MEPLKRTFKSLLLISLTIFGLSSYGLDKSEQYANQIFERVDRVANNTGLTPTKTPLIPEEGDPRYNLKNCFSSRAFAGKMQFGFKELVTRLYNEAFASFSQINKHFCYIEVHDPNKFSQCHIEMDATDTFGENYDAVHALFVSRQGFDGDYYIQICIQRYLPDL